MLRERVEEEIGEYANADCDQRQAEQGQGVLNDEAAPLDSLVGCEVEFTLCGSSGCHMIRMWTTVLSLIFGRNRATLSHEFYLGS